MRGLWRGQHPMPEYPRCTDEFPRGHWVRRMVAELKRRHHAEFLKLLGCRKRYPNRGRF